MQNTVEFKFDDYYVARIVRTNEHGAKEVVSEIPLCGKPDKEDIAEILMKYPKDVFLSVVHNYRRV